MRHRAAATSQRVTRAIRGCAWTRNCFAGLNGVRTQLCRLCMFRNFSIGFDYRTCMARDLSVAVGTLARDTVL